MTSGSGIEVVVAGHICLDMFPDLGALPPRALESPGRLFQVGGLRVTTGGLVANTGLALHRLGTRVRLISTVGDDLVGNATLESLRRASARFSEHIIIRPDTASSYTIVLSQPGVDRTFFHCTGPNETFSAVDVDFSLVEGAPWFHFGYPTLLPRLFAGEGRELVQIFARAKASGVATSLDFTLPDPTTPSGRADWPLILRLALAHVDVFVPSLEEVTYLMRREWYHDWSGDIAAHITRTQLDEIAAELLSMGPAIVGIKLGAQGLLLYGASAERMQALGSHIDAAEKWAGRIIEQSAFQVDVIGTTGAGDAAYAGLITALLRGLSPDDAALLSGAAGAASVESIDAVNGLPVWTELLARFTDWPTLPSSWL